MDNDSTKSLSIQSPESIPSVDEKNVQLGPNLAGNEELCVAVTRHIVNEFWYPYELLQMRMWDTWRRIDDAWRARVSPQDLELSGVTQANKKLLAQSTVDATAARAQTPAIFKQIKAITDIIVQSSWTGGAPVRAEVPDDVFEHPLYQPNEQSAQAANALINDTARKVNLHSEYRKNIGAFVKYGMAWAYMDFCKQYADIPVRHPLSNNPTEMDIQLQSIAQAFKVQPQVTMGEQGPEALFTVKRIKKMQTSFKHVDVADVFIDPLIPCDPIERQPCPILREHVTPFDIEGNKYDPVNNQGGYLNTELAIEETKYHYVLSQEDEAPLVDRLRHRHNITDSILQSNRQTIRQRWTAFPLLRINEQTGELDSGEGTTCPHCKGKGKMQAAPYVDAEMSQGDIPEAECETCEGVGKVHPMLKRYVVTIFGGLRMKNVCLRIQSWPEEMELPLQYAADMVEDTACAYPMSKTEIALIANTQLATAENQFLRAKEQSINRGWKVKEDSPANAIQDFNAPGQRINFETDPNEAVRIDSSNFDETVTLMPFIAERNQQIKDICGATDQVVGELAQGRRSALELGNAIEAGKNPIVVMGDSYNRQMMGGWGRRLVQNADLFGDRDWIREKTGREFFGNFKFFTAVGEEFVKKMGAQQNIRYLLESSAGDPSMQEVRPQLWNELFNLMGIKNVKVGDGGFKKSLQDGMRIVSQILGDGEFLPPLPEDPDEIYIGIFQEAIKDPYWIKAAPQNLHLLQQRLMMQQQQAFQKQIEQMQQQALMNPQMEQGGQPATPGRTPEDSGQAMQNLQG